MPLGEHHPPGGGDVTARVKVGKVSLVLASKNVVEQLGCEREIMEGRRKGLALWERPCECANLFSKAGGMQRS
jgi:hypothetical protein